MDHVSYILGHTSLFVKGYCSEPADIVHGTTVMFVSLRLTIVFGFIFGPLTDHISYRSSVFILLLGNAFHKSLTLRRFKLDRDEIRGVCSSSKATSIDGVGFLI